MSERILASQLEAWDRKPCLRSMYGRWFEDIRAQMAPGPCLEVGAGIGKFKESVPGVVTLDIEQTPWTDLVGDAQHLPVGAGSLGNIVLFDVLHHIPRPALFFAEAIRALGPGGRVIIMDPYISPASFPVYKYMHPENADMDCDPLDCDKGVCSDTPFDSNQAVATKLFFREAERFGARFPELAVVHRKRLALLSYPLSGGFGGRSLLPDGLIRSLAAFERKLGFLAPLLAFRTLIVLERHAA